MDRHTGGWGHHPFDREVAHASRRNDRHAFARGFGCRGAACRAADHYERFCYGGSEGAGLAADGLVPDGSAACGSVAVRFNRSNSARSSRLELIKLIYWMDRQR